MFTWVRVVSAIGVLAAAAALQGCGGGGDGGPIDPPGPMDPVDPVDPIDPTPPPGTAGPYAIDGIDRIPQSALKMTKRQMQGAWVIVDDEASHLRDVGRVACQSFVIDSPSCGESDRTRTVIGADGRETSRTGTAPFTELLYLGENSDPNVWSHAIWSTKITQEMGTARISVHTLPAIGLVPSIVGDDRPWLKVVSAGNDGFYFRELNELIVSWQQDANGHPYVPAAKARYWHGFPGAVMDLGARTTDCVDLETDGTCWINFNKSRWVNADEAHWTDSKGRKRYFFTDYGPAAVYPQFAAAFSRFQNKTDYCVDLDADGTCWIFMDKDDLWPDIHTLSDVVDLLLGFPGNEMKLEKFRRAILKDEVLIAAGYERDEKGNYVRNRQSSSCLGHGDACLWTQHDYPVGSGTSYAAPQLAAALASVLAVLPDTSYQDLARFAKACAKKAGDGIERLLREQGGHGVADFNCMGDVVMALGSLPTGGTSNLTINGNAVNLSSRALSSSFAPSQSARYLAGWSRDEHERFSLQVVSNGGREAMALGVFREGGFFASLGAGQYDSFFGYVRGHGTVSGIEYVFGHENLFLHLSDMTSRGGDLISWARARSMGLSAEMDFRPIDDVKVRLLAGVDRFLGGQAKISFSRVKMDEGEWSRRLGVSAEYAADDRTTLGIDTRAFFPGNGEAVGQVGFRFSRRF